MNQHSLPWRRLSKPVRVAIIGDLMLDEYLDGDVNRISPEAPVPVHLVKKTTLTAGGAANVARNIQLVGAQAILCGVWGDDGAGKDLERILSQDKIDTSLIFTDHERPTIKKTRIAAKNHQLVRIDWEKTHPIGSAIQNELIARLERTQFDVMLLSDYAKGALATEFVTELIELGQKKKVPVLIDPKGHDYARYRGSFLVTPNRKEACEALGLDPLENWPRRELAMKLQEKYGLRNVLITLGAEGMYLLPEKSKSDADHYLPAVAREVFDVSGAGDTVVGVMAVGVGTGLPFAEAMSFANLAAGVVVEKWGTQPIREHELVEAVQTEKGQRTSSTERKIVDIQGFLNEVGQPHEKRRRIVFTNGCFDILHAGHISYLEKARAEGDLLVIGLNTDASVKRLKGASRPIIPETERSRLLAALAFVDYVIPFGEDTPKQLIEAVAPDVLVKGADYSLDKIVGADFVMARGGEVKQIEFVDGLSTSEIIRRIQSQK